MSTNFEIKISWIITFDYNGSKLEISNKNNWKLLKCLEIKQYTSK